MALKISMASHDKLLRLVKAIQLKQQDFTDFYGKLEAIDQAYSQSKIVLSDTAECTGASSTVAYNEAIKVPIVNSEIDSIVAYLADIFVNRSPLFPVISDKATPELALKMQALISKDARQQKWGRQLLLFLANTTRYNIGAIEVDLTEQKDFNLASEGVEGKAQTEATFEPVTKLRALDMYNAIFDWRVAPADISMDGEYAGYNELISRTALKTYTIRLSEEGIAMNIKEALASSMAGIGDTYRNPPDISTTSQLNPEDTEDWYTWLGITNTSDQPKASYLKTRLYVRLIPKDFGLYSSKSPAHPRIVRLEIINNEHIISYKEIVTPMDMLPVLFSDMREDGFKYQTKSVGEGVLPFQEIATELMHTKLEGSKRALADRAIYDPEYIDTLDVNNPTAAAKIPLKKRLRNGGDNPPISSVYYQIPFESQGVMNAMQDLGMILDVKDQVNGTSSGMRGQHRKGNRTLGEYNDIEGSAKNKGMPYAVRIDEQVMTPLKLCIKFFLLSTDKVEREILDTASGTLLNINILELRKAMLDFKLTDGLRPKAALTDPTALSSALQFTQNSGELNRTYDVADIFAEMLALWDIDISKHKREVPLDDGTNTGTDDQNVQPKPSDQGG